MSALGSIYIEWRTISCWSSERNIFRISKKEGCLNSRTKYGTRRWRLARNRTTVLHALCRSQQLNSLFEVARLRTGAAEKHPPQIIYFMLFGLGLGCSLLAAFGMAASAGHSWIPYGAFCGNPDRRALHRDRYGISASRSHSDREFRSFPRRRLRSN